SWSGRRQFHNCTASSGRLRRQPINAATRRYRHDSPAYGDEHEWLEDGQADSKYVYVYKDRGIDWTHRDWTGLGLEPLERGLHFIMVAPGRERMESTNCAARFGNGWGFGSGVVAGPGDDRTAV